VWYRDALASYVRDMLLDSRSLSRAWVDRARLETAVESHIRGDRNYTNELHKILTLELFHRVLLEGGAGDSNATFAAEISSRQSSKNFAFR
jgi:asparagine synthase (glutamine-hydrolysing)